MEQNRLVKESAKLDPAFERTLSEEGFAKDMEQWPEYEVDYLKKNWLRLLRD